MKALNDDSLQCSIMRHKYFAAPLFEGWNMKFVLGRILNVLSDLNASFGE